MTIFVRARFTARDGRGAEFEQIVAALTARAAEESGTLTYRWFGPVDSEYLVLEQYADTPAALAHNAQSADLLARVDEVALMVSAELYGPLGPELQGWVATHPQVTAYPDFPPD
ncbi:antibiotic biosynthesis monooxygenase family protein [Actinoplanes sp. NPDC049596]|uniref:putative quinol monooxygenase n=1 Tax=unclassified Actinoplanes TaxID=2626549 RepID=UPI00342974F5